MEQPTFSVIIPTYNVEKYLERTLTSVAGQECNDYEIVVCDDGSVDRTRAILQEWRLKMARPLRILFQEHKGPGAARNRALRECRGMWIAFLDADDVWFPEKLAVVRQVVSKQKGIDVVCHDLVVRNRKRNTIHERVHRPFFDDRIHPFLSLYRSNCLSTSAVTVRSSLIQAADGFDETLPSAQDYDLWLRLSTVEGTNFGFIQRPLGYYETAGNRVSDDIDLRLECMLRVARKYDEVLRGVTRFAWIEKRRFVSQAYLMAAIQHGRSRGFQRCASYCLRGVGIWPFQFASAWRWLKRRGLRLRARFQSSRCSGNADS